MKFSRQEIRDLWFAGLMISLAFAILLNGGLNSLLNLQINFILSFVIAFFTAGLGFLLHELMHKFIAQRYGLWAEFKAFYGMLWFAVLASFFGFIFAAPGAVFMHGFITRERNGKISLAGPITNIILSILFLIGLLLFNGSDLINYFFSIGLTINSLLGAFNMIPVMPFDGAKIIAWDKAVYWITTIIAVGLFVVSWIF